VLEVELAASDQLFALESISNLLVSDGLLIQDVAKVGRVFKSQGADLFGPQVQCQ